MGKELSRLEYSRREREKELDGLYRLAVLCSRPEENIRGVFGRAAEILRKAMQYPDCTSVVVTGNELSVAVGVGREGVVRDTYGVDYTYGENRHVEVVVTYVQCAGQNGGVRVPTMVIEGREKHLIDSAATLLVNVLQRLEMTEELRASAEALERKQITLQEVLREIEREKVGLVQSVSAYVDTMVMPLVLELQGSSALGENEMVCLGELKKVLKGIFEVDPGVVMSALAVLSPREAEIAGLVRGGMSTKEIAKFLHVATATVERHRNTIRKKLGLQGKAVNLTTYLRSLG